MLFLLVFTALALAAITAVCLPLLRGVPMVAERGIYDRVVYRDQLKELDRDLARGVLNADEATSARLEIQRRLLAADTSSHGHKIGSQPSPLLTAVVSVLMLSGAAALYWHFGAPSLPDAPFADRSAQQAVPVTDSQHLDMRQAAVQLEQKLAAEPSNAEGWVLLARTVSMLGDWKKAGEAYRHAIALGQNQPDVLAGYGEMQVLAADGIVPPGAHDAFTEAVAADPKNDVARYYLALADHQAGEEKRAIERWLALAADIPADSSMREAIARGVADAAKAGGLPVPALPKGAPPQAQADAAPQAGPSDQQAAAAAQMPDGERKKMIQGMVSQLAARLQTEPNDLDGWLRLGRSYAVLGEQDKAANAFEHAATLKPDDPGIRLQEFQALIANLQPSDPLPARAVGLLREIALAAPNQPEVLWYLGVEAARMGNTAEARKNWTKLLSILPADSEDSKLVKTALDALK